jgi:hypothetical protein
MAPIDGVHLLLYSKDADADRRFLQDVLGFEGVDAGGGWMILGMPPTELAVHPSDDNFAQRHAGHEVLGAVIYFMCTDLTASMAALQARGASFTEIEKAGWGIRTTIKLPSGGEVGLYQPTHPSPLSR